MYTSESLLVLTKLGLDNRGCRNPVELGATTLLVVGELINELLDDPDVDREVFPSASLEGERRSGILGLGSCQSVNQSPMFSSVPKVTRNNDSA